MCRLAGMDIFCSHRWCSEKFKAAARVWKWLQFVTTPSTKNGWRQSGFEQKLQATPQDNSLEQSLWNNSELTQLNSTLKSVKLPALNIASLYSFFLYNFLSLIFLSSVVTFSLFLCLHSEVCRLFNRITKPDVCSTQSCIYSPSSLQGYILPHQRDPTTSNHSRHRLKFIRISLRISHSHSKVCLRTETLWAGN